MKYYATLTNEVQDKVVFESVAILPNDNWELKKSEAFGGYSVPFTHTVGTRQFKTQKARKARVEAITAIGGIVTL